MRKPSRCSQCANPAERVCSRCGDALCYKCHVKGVCVKCRVIINDKSLIDEYFREKYAQKEIAKVMMNVS